MPARVAVASIIAILGTLVFLVVRAVLVDLIEPPVYVAGCFVGAFVSTLVLVAPRRRTSFQWLAPAAGICLATFLSIAISHLMYRATDWDNSVPGEALSLVFWAIFVTSWWVMPPLVGLLALLTWLFVPKRENAAA
jgi:hypothetical protein